MGYYAHALCFVVRVSLSRVPVETRLVAENIFVLIPTLDSMETLSFLESMGNVRESNCTATSSLGEG